MKEVRTKGQKVARHWTPEKIAKLLSCNNDVELKKSFPSAKLSSLKRRQRQFRDGNTANSTSIPTAPSGWNAGIEITGDSGTLCSGPLSEPIEDWTELLKLWNLDPLKFEVVEPVTFKAWDMGIKNSELEIETKRMYSYKATIKRIYSENLSIENVDSWRAILQKTTFSLNKKSTKNKDSVSYLILPADAQLGKPGTNEAVDNWMSGVDRHIERINRLSSNYDITELVIAFQGDETENTSGHYSNQSYEVELSLKNQLELDFDMTMYTLKRALELGLPIKVSSVPSNHGELGRDGRSKPITSVYDNSSTMIRNLVAKTFNETKFSEKIEWHVADNQADITLIINGVKANFSHGHIAKGRGPGEQKVKTALDRQLLGRATELHDVSQYYVAHYHHFYVIEERGRTVFGCPALESARASGWFMSQYGVWSDPGMLGLLVGQSLDRRGWAEIAVL